MRLWKKEGGEAFHFQSLFKRRKGSCYSRGETAFEVEEERESRQEEEEEGERAVWEL